MIKSPPLNSLAHQPLLQALRNRISQMLPGERLPPVRELMRRHGVAPVTLERCLSYLENEGAIQRMPRKGIYVLDQSSPRTSIEAYGLVLPVVGDAIYASLIGKFTQASHGTFHEVLMRSTNFNTDRQGNALMGLLEMGIAAVAVAPVPYVPSPPHQFRLLQKNRAPVVLLHRPVSGVSAPLLRLPFQRIAETAGDYLAERGHRRVAALLANRDIPPTDGPMAVNEVNEAYAAGLRCALERLGGVYCDDLASWWGRCNDDEHKSELRRCLKQLLDVPRDVRPTAIFTSNDLIAESAYLLLTEMGVSVGEEMSIICFGNSRRQTLLRHRLTTITLDETWTAETAVQLIEEMRNGSRPLIDSFVCDIPLKFHPGSTVGTVSEGKSKAIVTGEE